VTIPPALLTEPWRHDLFNVLRAFERSFPWKPRIGDSTVRADEYLTISQDPYLEFPASTIGAASVDPGGRHRLFVRFLGMFGPQGALPLTTTEEAFAWVEARDSSFARFVDVVQNRFLQLFFRAWADARPISQHDRPDGDRFVAFIGSTSGIGTPAYLGRDSLSTYAKLQFAGLLGAAVKSATRLESLIAGLFGVRVEIEQCQGAWLQLEPEDCSRLGTAHSALGRDTMAGSSVFAVDKMRVRIFVADLDEYGRFLPTGDFSRRLADAVFLYCGEEIDWDVELAIPEDKVVPVTLGGGARLGWTGWMAPPAVEGEPKMRMDTRFHLAERFADERSAAAEG
jgi:type VI secretion system protein ImpH